MYPCDTLMMLFGCFRLFGAQPFAQENRGSWYQSQGTYSELYVASDNLASQRSLVGHQKGHLARLVKSEMMKPGWLPEGYYMLLSTLLSSDVRGVHKCYSRKPISTPKSKNLKRLTKTKSSNKSRVHICVLPFQAPKTGHVFFLASFPQERWWGWRGSQASHCSSGRRFHGNGTKSTSNGKLGGGFKYFSPPVIFFPTCQVRVVGIFLSSPLFGGNSYIYFLCSPRKYLGKVFTHCDVRIFLRVLKNHQLEIRPALNFATLQIPELHDINEFWSQIWEKVRWWNWWNWCMFFFTHSTVEIIIGFQ